MLCSNKIELFKNKIFSRRIIEFVLNFENIIIWISVNYCNVRKEILCSGSTLLVDYDQEMIYYKGQCLVENTSSMLDKMIECSLQPKSFISKVKSNIKLKLKNLKGAENKG